MTSTPVPYFIAISLLGAFPKICEIFRFCDFFCHGLHRSNAGTVLTAITLSYGKCRNSTPHRIKTPSLVDMKLWTYDYVREICPQIYFCKNPCSGGFCMARVVNYNISIFIYRPFFLESPTSYTRWQMFAWNYLRMCLLGLEHLN